MSKLQVKNFNYLGTMIEDTGKMNKETDEELGTAARLHNIRVMKKNF